MKIWLENNKVIAEPNAELAELNFGITRPADKEYTDEEWKNIHGMVRLINGELFEGYTEEELKEQKLAEVEQKLAEAHKFLEETDYVAIKIAEGVSSKEDYAEILEKRQNARNFINDNTY